MSNTLREFFQGSEDPYVVLADLHKNGHIVNFFIYQGNQEVSDEDPLLIGHIKWDGCSNWHFPHSNYPLHFCNQSRAKQFGDLLSEMYNWASELLPTNKENLGS